MQAKTSKKRSPEKSEYKPFFVNTMQLAVLCGVLICRPRNFEEVPSQV